MNNLTAILYICIVYCVIISGCHSHDRSELIGLWEVVAIEVDAEPEPFIPTYIQINANGIFAVSRSTGDLNGIYKYDHETIEMQSEEPHWFNTSWSVHFHPDYIQLVGFKKGYRTTKITLHPLDKIPDQSTFIEKISGSWELYKIRKKGTPEPINNTSFDIHPSESYAIKTDGQIIESGPIIINPRHQKLIFVTDSTTWNIWFYGEELRLDNEPLQTQYSLRNRILFGNPKAH